MCYSSGNQFIAQIPTWILIVSGWYAVHYFAKERDKCKEARERLDQLILTLRAIEEKAIQFHQSTSYKGDIARTLVFDIQRIIAKLKRHPLGSFNISPNLQKELRQSITLKNFDASQFSYQPDNSLILSKVANAVDDIEDQLEKEYERIYL